MIVLQKFGFKESKYERPQDAWVCGRLADGKPCDLGPGLDGRCRVTTVCQPRLENDRWQCRRSASAGGACEAGPLPDGQCCLTLERCVPVRSLRAKRKRGTLAAIALMVGILAIALAGEGGRHFMMPGKLSAHHAGLTDCSTCHAGARSGQVDLLHRLFTAVEPRQNSNLCVTCHVMGAEPFTPHTHPVEDLRRVTENLRSASKGWPAPSLMQRIAFPSAVTSRRTETEIQCATCHKEHGGVFADLKAVSNQRCQACHVARFGSFADTHPQFAKFPYHRRPRIAFDHQSHMAKYFPDAAKAATAGKVAPEDCGDCHQLGVRKKYMVVKPFPTMCSSCHSGDITGAAQVSGPKGIGVIAVPGLDVKTLSERGIDIGGWPKDSEAVLTPFMRLFLGSHGQNVISGVAELDLLDLSKASDGDLARVGALAWAVKRLFNQLETTNPAATLPGDRSGAQVDALQMSALTGSMSHDVITAANREWFPDLEDDLQRHGRGEPTRNFKPPAKPMTGAANPPPAPADSKPIAATKPPGAASSDILAPGGNVAGNKDDILGSDKQDDALTPTNKDALAPSKQDDILAPNKDDILSGDKSSAGSALSALGDDSAVSKEKETDAGAEAKKLPAPARFDPEAWAQTGGWYREDFTIRYHPAGHTDQFLQTWLDFAGRAYGSGLHDELAPIFDELAAKDAVGRCTKCHSIDDGGGAKIVNWRPFDANVINNRFTNFSHKPHVELIGAKTCVRCHQLQQTNNFSKTYAGGDPVNYTPNFKYLDKALCATCHSQQTVWENCTLCHGYHVPDVNSDAAIPSLPVALEQSVVSGGAAALPMLNPEAKAGRDYARAEEIGTEQAWNDFITSYPSGHFHDLAVQRIAELSRGTREKSAIVVPEKPAPGKPGDLATVAPDKSALVTPDKPATVPPEILAPAPPERPVTATPGKTAAVTPEDSAPAKPADSADAREPTDLEGFYRRGQQRALQGDFALALQDFDEVVRRDPKNSLALNDRCWVRALLDETQAALKDCNASLQAAPNFPDALDSRGLVNLKLGYYEKAIADYTAALSQFRGARRASALYGRGIAKRRSGNVAGAKADIDIAKVYNPDVAGEFARYGIQ